MVEYQYRAAHATCRSGLDFYPSMPYTSPMNEKPTYPNPWNPDDPAEWRPVTRTWAFTRQYKVPKELERLMWAGKLNQQCPYCNHVEPAGAFCHNCERQVTPDSYFQSRALDENGKPRRGRPRKEDMNKMVGVTNGNA